MIDLTDINVHAMRTKMTMLYGQLSGHMSPLISERWMTAVSDPWIIGANVRALEPAYAHMKAVPDDAATLAPILGQQAYLVASSNLMSQGDRALAIYDACRRALGEAVPGADPDIDPAFVPPPEPEPVSTEESPTI